MACPAVGAFRPRNDKTVAHRQQRRDKCEKGPLYPRTHSRRSITKFGRIVVILPSTGLFRGPLSHDSFTSKPSVVIAVLDVKANCRCASKLVWQDDDRTCSVRGPPKKNFFASTPPLLAVAQRLPVMNEFLLLRKGKCDLDCRPWSSSSWSVKMEDLQRSQSLHLVQDYSPVTTVSYLALLLSAFRRRCHCSMLSSGRRFCARAACSCFWRCHSAS